MWFVGPDNRLMAPAADRIGFEQAWEITNLEMLPSKVSEVFDGRDVFGPTGALLSNGVLTDEIGTKIDEIIRFPHYQPEIDGDVIHGNVIHIDGFGNTVTNVTYETLQRFGVEGKAIFKLTVDDKAG